MVPWLVVDIEENIWWLVVDIEERYIGWMGEEKLDLEERISINRPEYSFQMMDIEEGENG